MGDEDIIGRTEEQLEARHYDPPATESEGDDADTTTSENTMHVVQRALVDMVLQLQNGDANAAAATLFSVVTYVAEVEFQNNQLKCEVLNLKDALYYHLDNTE